MNTNQSGSNEKTPSGPILSEMKAMTGESVDIRAGQTMDRAPPIPPDTRMVAVSPKLPPGISLFAESTPAQVGPYRLLKKMGEGGMGVVYLAEQQHPVRRQVALKLIKPGRDNSRVVVRFEAERQALALMDHPNIAKVLDAGTVVVPYPGVPKLGSEADNSRQQEDSSRSAPSNRPYFVMELVKGIPVTQYCDQEHLTLKARLELFVPICQAVQHAHQKGVIHRDLKPSNILVGLSDGKAVPKVIDFGVAKATQQRLTERTMCTEVGEIIGTLEYMAPEQIEVDNLDIDTRADIYSLGIVLYELLTGSPPFSREEVRSGSFAEMLRLIREVEPPRPSTRLSTLDGLQTVAQKRKLEPKRLLKLVEGELDWIVMRCLEKDRGRRYETANELALDIERYLRNEPVRAGPPSVGYRLRKFYRRHRGAVLAGACMVGLLIAATAISTWFAFWALAAERQALRESDAKEKARLAEAYERQRADEQAAQARAVNEFFLQDILALASPERHPDRDLRLRTVLDLAAQKIEGRFAGRPQLEATVRLTLGDAYRALFENAAARPHLERALALRKEHLGEQHPATIQAMLMLARLCRNQMDLERSQVLYERAYAICHALYGDDHADTLTALHGQAALFNTRRMDHQAETLLSRIVQGRTQVLGRDHPDTLKTRSYLTVTWMHLQKYQEVKLHLPELLEAHRKVLGEDHPETLQVMSLYSSFLIMEKNYAQAEELTKRTLTGLQQTLGEFNNLTLIQIPELASIYHLQGKFKEESDVHAQFLDSLRRHPHRGTPPFAGQLADLGMRLYYRNGFEPAEAVFRECLDIRQKAEPHVWTTFQTEAMLGAALLGQKKYAQAERHLLQGYQALRNHVNNSPQLSRDSTIRIRLAEALERIVALYDAWGKKEQVEKWRAVGKVTEKQ